MEAYKVLRAFERYDGKGLKRYKRGTFISPKDAAKIPSWSRLLAGGFVQLIPTEIKFQGGAADGT